MLCNISQNAMRQRGGYPVRYPPRGGTWTPPPHPPGGVIRSGTPPPPRGGYLTRGVPSQVPPWGVPDPGGVPRPPRGGGTRSGTPPRGYPGRTTEGVLTTRRAVCLLRSRRRTFLLEVWNQKKNSCLTTFLHNVQNNNNSPDTRIIGCYFSENGRCITKNIHTIICHYVHQIQQGHLGILSLARKSSKFAHMMVVRIQMMTS